MTDEAPIDLAALGVRRAGASPEVRAFLRGAIERAESEGAVAEGYLIGERWAPLLGGIATLQQRVVTHGSPS